MTLRDRWRAFLNPPSIDKQTYQPSVGAQGPASLQTKFTPADESVNWIRVETLVHGPGASDTAASGADANSVVFSCLMAICTAYIEPPCKVWRSDDAGDREWLPDDPLQALLDMPGPSSTLSLEEYWFWTQWAKHTDGNAYWLKQRSGNRNTGNVIGLELCSPALIHPITERDSGDFISYYNLQTAPGKFEPVPVENVVHFRLGLDPHDLRLGLSPLKRLIRQISTDEQADKFTDSLLRNYAVPGLIVVTQDPNLDQDTADLIKARIHANFGSGNVGNVAVLSNGAEIKTLSFSPEQMDVQTLHRTPEERIAAVMRVPPIVANLGAGLDAATYSNYKQAREAFTEDTLVPLWRMDAATLNRQLKPDFTSDKAVMVAFDLSDVRSLQEDEDRKYARLNLGVQGPIPWIRVNEARAEIGLPPDDGLEALQVAPKEPELAQQTEEESVEEEPEEEEIEGMPVGGNGNGRNGQGKAMSLALQAAIAGALQHAHTPDEIAQVFDDVWAGYP